LNVPFGAKGNPFGDKWKKKQKSTKVQVMSLHVHKQKLLNKLLNNNAVWVQLA